MKHQPLSKISAILLLLFCLLFSSGIQARPQHLIRNQGFFYAFEGFHSLHEKLNSSFVINTDAFSPLSYGFKASVNWFVNYHMSVGTGVGLINYESPRMFTFPVVANTQFYLSEGSDTPFAYAEGGYGWRLNHKNQDKGLIYELGLGYRYRIKWENFLVVKVGYHYFKNNQWEWRRRLQQPIDPLNLYEWTDLTRRTISISIAFYYSTRY